MQFVWHSEAVALQLGIEFEAEAFPHQETELAKGSSPERRRFGVGILCARHLSLATTRNIRQNLFFAFIYNAIGVPLAAGVPFPAFGLLLNLMTTAAAMSLSSVSVVMNTLGLGTTWL